MTLKNIPSVMDLIGNADGIPDLDLETIGVLIEDAKALSARATRVSRALQEEVEHRLKDQIQAAYLAKGEDTGTVSIPCGAQNVDVSRPKKVEWDQDSLKAIGNRMKAEGLDPHEYIDRTYTVVEKRYTAWPASIQSKFTDARTVKTGSVSIKIKEA